MQVNGHVYIHDNPNLAHVDVMLDSLQFLGGYFQLEFANGTIDCPEGSGVFAGDEDLMLKSNDGTDNISHGNWCTFNCRYPREVQENWDEISAGLTLDDDVLNLEGFEGRKPNFDTDFKENWDRYVNLPRWGQSKRMWATSENDVWDPTLGPLCLS